VIAARLLAAHGLLSKRGLDCRKCERDPGRKKHLGCGVAPPLRDGSSWNPAQWRADHPGMPASMAPYNYANLGSVGEHGWLWPCCPRYFDAFAETSASASADSITRLIYWLNKPAGLDHSRLTSGTAQLLRLADTLNDRFIGIRRAEQQKADREKREREARAKARRGGR